MSVELAIILANLEEEIGDTMDKILDSVEDANLSSEAMMDMCLLSRQWGIGLLLLDANIDGYVAGLFKSGRTYVCLLENTDENPGIEPYYLCRSRATPFFDAAAIGDRQAMQSITRLCTQVWRQDMEEADDFWYLDFLMTFFERPQDTELLGQKLEEFERSLQGISSLRYNACAAVCSRDEDRYWEALMDLLEERSQKVLDDLQNERLEPAYAHTEAYVLVEGVMLVKMGQLAGFTAASEYLLVPSIALQASLSTCPQDDPWDELRHLLR